MVERSRLPFRSNCEGYFLKGENILAKQTKEGIIIFPGGGIDDNETIEEGMLRETKEETGAIITELKKLGNMNLIWGPQWAKTEKQKKRYEHYQGDDMTFFSGVVKEFQNTEVKEDTWGENKFIPLEKVIQILRLQLIEADEEIRPYREKQLFFLEGLNQ